MAICWGITALKTQPRRWWTVLARYNTAPAPTLLLCLYAPTNDTDQHQKVTEMTWHWTPERLCYSIQSPGQRTGFGKWWLWVTAALHTEVQCCPPPPPPTRTKRPCVSAFFGTTVFVLPVVPSSVCRANTPLSYHRDPVFPPIY